MKTRRRRKGFDEERKRELRKDLDRYFTLSKNISISDRNFSGQESNSQGQQLSPEAQLEQSQQFGHNFGDVSVFPEQNFSHQESELASEEQESATPQNTEAENLNETLYSKLGLEQLQDREEARKQELYSQQAQYLIDMPGALESANQGHILKAFNEPFLVLEELLVMAEWENPGLDALQRLWLVWGKWETYYTAWHAVVNENTRQLPGKGRDTWSDRYQERGIHDLETAHLENTILRVMRREIGKKSEQEQEFINIPTHHQLHCYFLDLRRQDWDATSWQRRTPNGAATMLEQEEYDDENQEDEVEE